MQINQVVEENTTNIEELQTEISAIIQNQNNYLDKLAYSFDGENLYLAYNDNSGTEITYWFKKCMANKLYTFYRVGYRNTETNIPSTNGISSGTDITYINSTASDNIGPFAMSQSWVGGNHHYPGENYSPNYLTAKTETYDVYIDNKQLQQGDSGICKYIEIQVNNTIFDPAYPPSEGDTILSTPLCTEFVTYTVIKNTI